MEQIRPGFFIKPQGNPETCKLVILTGSARKSDLVADSMLAGAEGFVLSRILSQIGLSPHSIYSTYLIKDIVTNMDRFVSWSPRFNRVRVEDAGKAYLEVLTEELKSINPGAVIVAVGDEALWALTGQWGIRPRRGSVYQSVLSPHKVVGCLPFNLIHKGEPEAATLMAWDFDKALQIQKGEFNPADTWVKTKPSIAEVYEWFAELNRTDNPIAFDIEVKNEEVCSIGFACETHLAYCIPFQNAKGNYFTPPQEVEVWQLICYLLENPSKKKIAQNAMFDCQFLLKKYGIRVQNCEDTMIAQKLIMPGFPAGLGFIASLFTDIPYYKDEGKAWFKGSGGTWDSLWNYNGKDCLVCTQAWPKQMEILEQQGNLSTYKRKVELLEPLLWLSEKGVKADIESFQSDYDLIEEKIKVLEQKFCDMAGRKINVKSPSQLVQFFYKDQGHAEYKKKGKATVGEEAIRRLVRKGIKEAVVLQEIKNLRKAQEFSNIESKIDSDGRFRCVYSPVGGDELRISSGANLFGKGANLDDANKYFRKCLVSDEGFDYYRLTLTSPEVHLVAYLGSVGVMLSVIEGGWNLDRWTAGVILGKEYFEVSNEPGSCEFSMIGESELDIGSWANRFLIYEEGYKAFALEASIPERVAKKMAVKFHAEYPEIKSIFFKDIRYSIASTGGVTNLLGRKIPLFKPAEHTDKHAAQMIVRSTIADYIDKFVLNVWNYDWEGDLEVVDITQGAIGVQVKREPLNKNSIGGFESESSIPFHVKGRSFFMPYTLTKGVNLNPAEIVSEGL